jgi:hypothetical protein
MYAAGFYIYSIFALLFWETRRRDFGVSISHHVATVVLIVMSYICRYGGERKFLSIQTRSDIHAFGRLDQINIVICNSILLTLEGSVIFELTRFTLACMYLSKYRKKYS